MPVAIRLVSFQVSGSITLTLASLELSTNIGRAGCADAAAGAVGDTAGDTLADDVFWAKTAPENVRQNMRASKAINVTARGRVIFTSIQF